MEMNGTWGKGYYLAYGVICRVYCVVAIPTAKRAGGDSKPGGTERNSSCLLLILICHDQTVELFCLWGRAGWGQETVLQFLFCVYLLRENASIRACANGGCLCPVSRNYKTKNRSNEFSINKSLHR